MKYHNNDNKLEDITSSVSINTRDFRNNGYVCVHKKNNIVVISIFGLYPLIAPTNGVHVIDNLPINKTYTLASPGFLNTPCTFNLYMDIYGSFLGINLFNSELPIYANLIYITD